MIEVYSWATPNGHKVHIMLEECGLPYRGDPGRHRRRRPVQARVPRRSARTTRSRRSSIPTAPTASRSRCSSRARSCSTWPARPAASCPPTCAAATRRCEWLMFQMGGVGPMLGQAHHFRHLRAREDRLRDRPLHQRGQAPLRRDGQAPGRSALHRRPTTTRSPTSPSSRGCARGRTRASTGPTSRTSRAGSTRSPRGPAVQRGVEVLAGLRKPLRDAKAREILFGARQYERR